MREKKELVAEKHEKPFPADRMARAIQFRKFPIHYLAF